MLIISKVLFSNFIFFNIFRILIFVKLENSITNQQKHKTKTSKYLTNCFFSDLSERCADNQDIYTYLTSGIDSTDYFIGLIANEKELNCSLVFSVKTHHYVMISIEFIDWLPGRDICSPKDNIVNVVRCDEFKI